LDFDIDTLRITDPGEEGQTDASQPATKGSSILAGLQRTSNTQEPWERAQAKPGVDPLAGIDIKKTPAQVESSKLRQLINNLGTDDEV
jgi:hypothetical protein